MKIFEYAKSHPYEVGGGVFLLGLAVLYFMGVFGGGSSASSSASNGDAAAEAYYSAQSQQAVAGDELQAVQIQSQAATAQNQSNNAANVDINNTWATENLATTQSNNATAITLAPYQVQADLLSGLAGAASQPGAVLTQTSSSSDSSNGFFGLFGGSSSGSQSTQTYVPNQGAETAADTLSALAASDGFNVSH